MRVVSWLWRLPRVLLALPVRVYRLVLSPWVGQSCRFTPTCSAYTLQALDKHGAILGAGLAGWRILRCNPWCHGGCDEVPDNRPWDRAKAPPPAHPASGLFTGLLRTDAGSGPDAAAPTTPATDQ